MSRLLLSRSYDFPYSVIPASIIETKKQNYVIVGRAFDGESTSSAFMTMVLPNGNILWQKTLNFPFTQFFTDVTQLNDGNFVATGSFFYSQYSGDEYLWIVKFNEVGKILWQKAYGAVGIQSDGKSIYATEDGGFVVTGAVVENDKIATRIFKFDALNNLEWSKTYGIGNPFSIIQTKDGGYALTGAAYKEDSLLTNAFILRLNPKGENLWQKVYEDYDIYVLLDSSIIETKNGHFAITAKSLIMEVEACGTVIWAKQDDEYNLSSIQENTEGNFVVAGALIVNDIDHAYISTINRIDRTTLNDNTELLYPSGFTKVILNSDGFSVTCGYAPNDIEKLLVILAIF